MSKSERKHARRRLVTEAIKHRKLVTALAMRPFAAGDRMRLRGHTAVFTVAEATKTHVWLGDGSSFSAVIFERA